MGSAGRRDLRRPGMLGTARGSPPRTSGAPPGYWREQASAG